MARVLALSSHVGFGSVGLAAIVPGLQSLGHEVIAVPTVVLSNHPGYGPFSGERVSAAMVGQMMDALDANGWLETIDAVLTGYLPAAEHVTAAKAAVARVRAENPGALYVCDPVFGDEPGGLYLDEATADAIGQHLIPLCDVATPNLFELAWLADKEVDDLDSAFSAARLLDAPRVLATSVPGPDEQLATLLVHADTAQSGIVIDQYYSFAGCHAAQALMPSCDRQPRAHASWVVNTIDVLEQPQPRRLDHVRRVYLRQPEVPSHGPDQPGVLIDEAFPGPFIPGGGEPDKHSRVSRAAAPLWRCCDRRSGECRLRA